MNWLFLSAKGFKAAVNRMQLSSLMDRYSAI
uniref:Uncharacterized protein n=1 Tax=Anguilla anguilla TaxID=7936 RepID=A0A0E9VA23_ANGAN